MHAIEICAIVYCVHAQLLKEAKMHELEVDLDTHICQEVLTCASHFQSSSQTETQAEPWVFGFLDTKLHTSAPAAILWICMTLTMPTWQCCWKLPVGTSRIIPGLPPVQVSTWRMQGGHHECLNASQRHGGVGSSKMFILLVLAELATFMLPS